MQHIFIRLQSSEMIRRARLLPLRSFVPSKHVMAEIALSHNHESQQNEGIK